MSNRLCNPEAVQDDVGTPLQRERPGTNIAKLFLLQLMVLWNRKGQNFDMLVEHIDSICNNKSYHLRKYGTTGSEKVQTFAACDSSLG